MANSLIDLSLFELKSLITNVNVKLSTRIENGVKQLLAIVTSDGELLLHYIYGNIKPVVKYIPWLKDSKKVIQDVCFDPTATWLLVLTLDSSLYIIPALWIVDQKQKIDCKWSLSDFTYFPRTEKSPAATPGCVVWWQTLDCNQNAIIGHDNGDISFVSLTDGQNIGITSITGPVIKLNICHDNSLDTVSLLITSENKQQWRLLLEQRTTGYIWSPEPNHLTVHSPSVNDLVNLSSGSSQTSSDNEQRSTRSRLQGLRQMSVERIHSLKQRLAESRSYRNSKIDRLISDRRQSFNSELGESNYTPVNIPEKLTNLGEIYLRPQYARNRHLFSGYYSPNSILTIHGIEVDAVPLFVHKLYPNCRDVLFTDRFIYTVDSDYNSLSIVSCPLSESQLDGDSEFNPESLITTFKLPNPNEIILSIFKLTDITLIGERNSGDDAISKSNKVFTLPNDVSDLNIHNPKIDTCILVTNFNIYKVILRSSIVKIFMDLVCKDNNLEKAERLAFVFGLNLLQLLEHAGDLMLSKSKFPHAITLYKLSRCRLLKSVLKFAVSGHASELLGYISSCLSAPNIDMSLPTKIHLSNLAVMSYTEIHLRYNNNSLSRLKNFNQFMEFLSRNDYYDQVLAVNVLCQTALWGLLTILVRTRGLVHDVMETVCKLLKTASQPAASKMIDFDDMYLHYCLTDSMNLQCLIIKPNIAKIFFSFVLLKLDVFEMNILKRLLDLLNPSQPVIRPLVVKLFDQFKRRRTVPANFESTMESIDSIEASEEQFSTFQNLIETFITVLLFIIEKTTKKPHFDIALMKPLEINYSEKAVTPVLSIKYRTLSSGFGHIALIRNNSVWTWGNTACGSLGNGPVMTKCSLPQSVNVLNNLCLEVISVSCGRMHTLVLTSCGVYAWGSNTFGQLGVESICQTSYPMLIESLANEQIIDICAGQYHSIALTATGKLYTWGWGVHGQLGHGDIEDVKFPKIVEFFSDIVVAQAVAGHAHTVVLTSKGEVYSFGSNLFGQLGNGTTFKSNRPQKVTNLPEKVVLVSTEYFQNFAVSVTNKLYTWGASPQVLRLAAQAQKKAKILQQVNIPAAELQEEMAPVTETVNDETPIADEIPKAVNDPELKQCITDLQNTIQVLGFKTGKSVSVSDSIGPSNGSTANNTSSTVSLPSLANSNDPELQPHLYPRLVDTSLVQGVIVNVVSGCHHAALLTKDGTVYTWGKNLDGQLGTGNRKEVLIPTPVKINPVNFISSVSSPIKQDDTDLHDLKCTHISCGAEYTVAIDNTGRVLAWGNNAYAQLGKIPDEEQKGLEGKMVLLRTTKRIIKLPSSIQNVSDTPKEVLNLPSQTITYRNIDKKSFIDLNQPHLFALKDIETFDNKFNDTKSITYGHKTLHFVLETYLGFYDSEKILKKALEYDNLQAASKISYLDCYFTDSLGYQLKSLENFIRKHRIEKLNVNLSETNLCSSNDIVAKLNIDNKLNDNTVSGKRKINSDADPIQIQQHITFSPSLESIKHFDDACENQGGHEQMCDDIPTDMSANLKHDDAPKSISDIDSTMTEDKRQLVRNTVIEYVESVDENLLQYDHTLCPNIPLSKIFSEKDEENSNEQETNFKKNEMNSQKIEKLCSVTDSQIVEHASRVLEFYIEKTQNTENHILMQNILIKSMDFWLSNNLPVSVLENILLKNMAKYFYPLSILLFCKNFNNNLGEAINKNDEAQQSQKSFLFLKQLSTKFCLQLCSMVLKSVEKS